MKQRSKDYPRIGRSTSERHASTCGTWDEKLVISMAGRNHIACAMHQKKIGYTY
jgi:hypothetical protein